jgi:prepilin-type N-terminal cleavage/methylation domain-containing protein
MSARGFTLIELLIALLLVLAVSGAVAATIAPARDLLRRWHEGMELESSARAALEQIAADLRDAGADSAVMPVTALAPRGVPAVELLSDLDAVNFEPPARALLIRRVPQSAAQGRLVDPVLAGGSLLNLSTATACATGGPSCGFEPGDAAVLFSESAAEVVDVHSTGGGWLQLSTPVTQSFPAGAAVCRVEVTRYGVRSVGGGVWRLVRLTSGGAEQPLLDNVVAFEIAPDVIDFSRMRRLTVRLRLQAGSDDLRGSGDWFANGGRAARLSRWVSDVELRTDLALRNQGGFR